MSLFLFSKNRQASVLVRMHVYVHFKTHCGINLLPACGMPGRLWKCRETGVDLICHFFERRMMPSG
jgi:hypothetical protein